MIWPMALYEYVLMREGEKRRRPIPEELEYVEMLR